MSYSSALLLVGQLPPPWHGQAVATQMLFEHHWEGYEVGRLRMSYSVEMEDVGRLRLNKIGHLFSLICQTRAWLKAHPGAVLFYPPASPQWTPFLRDVAYLWFTRHLAGSTVFIYHAGGVAEWIQKSMVRQALARLVYHRADLSLEVAAETPSPHELFRAKCWKWSPYGIDVPDRPRLLPTKNRIYEVLFVGSLQEGKGVLELIRTARVLLDRGQGGKFRFKLVGPWFSPKFEAEAKKLVSDLGLETMIDFAGQLTGDAKWHAYQSANLFFFPTHYASEAFPIVLIEALGCGLPVVTTRWRGIPSLLEGCDSSTLCETRDPNGFADAIEFWEGKRGQAQLSTELSICFYAERYKPVHFLRRIEDELGAMRSGDRTMAATAGIIRSTDGRDRGGKLKILQVFNQYLERGGEEIWVNEMLRLCDGEFEIHDLRFHSRAWNGRGAPNRLVQALRLWNNPQARLLLREAVTQYRPDVLIFHNLIPVASLGLYTEAAALGIPVIQFAHNFRPFSISGTLWYKGHIQDAALRGNPWPEILHGAWEGSVLKTALLAFYYRRLMKRGVFNSIAKWVTVSDFMKEKFIMGGMTPERVTSLRHCWHTQSVFTKQSEQDYYLFLGRLVPEKGISVLLDAWDQLALRLGDACPRLVIAGSGAEEARVHEGAAHRHKVTCVGFVDGDEKERLINECRAVLAPSIWWEPMGLIVYEAYNHARPVLAAKSGGLQETVIDGTTGYLHEPGNALALAKDVVRMEDIGQDGRQVMGAAGRQWLLTHACPDHWRQSLKNIIQEVLTC